jgi:uncharacterized repeat protein (TIGR03803 family)
MHSKVAMRHFGRSNKIGWLLIAAALSFLGVGSANSAGFKSLHSFCTNCAEGTRPSGPLLRDSAGNLYGVTRQGGEFGLGSVYELVRTEIGRYRFRTIHSFCHPSNDCVYSGENPTGPLIIDAQGNLYGATGFGTTDSAVFKLLPGNGRNGKGWVAQLLYRFCAQANCIDGYLPAGGLTYAGAATGVSYDGISPLYGTTQAGGAQNRGTVFQLTPDQGSWTETVLYSFCYQGGTCSDGVNPTANVIVDANGNLFGTTQQGGVGNSGKGGGVAFELSSSGGTWSYTPLYQFCALADCADGSEPIGGLTFDANGNLLGVTELGGSPCAFTFGCGTAYEITPNGAASQHSVLYSFCRKRDCADGNLPSSGLTLDSTGNLYGVTALGGGHDIDQSGDGGGTAFQLSGTSLKVLHRFCSLANCADGEEPQGTLALDSNGALYGTTSYGGTFGGVDDGGTVFSVPQ